MSWETRNGRQVYTRTYRRDGQVVREYFGSGEVAELAAEHDLIEQRERRQRREQRQREMRSEKQVDELCALATVLANAFLVSVGYHRHHRSEWRKARGKSKPRP